MISPEDIRKGIDRLGGMIDRWSGNTLDSALGDDICRLLRELRAEYSESRSSFGTEQVDELRDLKQRFVTLLTGSMSAIVDRFSALTELLQETKTERERWREILGEAVDGDSVQFAGSTSVVVVTTATRMELPKRNTGDHQELEQLLRDSELWSEVSSISRPLLTKAMDRSDLDKEIRDRIGALCPVVTSSRFAIQPLDAGD